MIGLMSGAKDSSFRAKRGLGQNFLVDPNVARKIVSTLNPLPKDWVIEIGSGKGALTDILAGLDVDLLVFERDIYLARVVKKRYPDLSVVGADCLEIDWARINRVINQGKVVGCLPYNIASPLLWELVLQFRSFVRMVFTVQEEVALRIVARPGSKVYGALSVWIQTLVEPNYEFGIKPNVFRPRPKVDSAVISFRPRQSVFSLKLIENLRFLLRVCFQARRKQLRKILKSFMTSDIDRFLLAKGIEPHCRPEQLSPQQFVELSNAWGE